MDIMHDIVFPAFLTLSLGLTVYAIIQIARVDCDLTSDKD